MAHILFCTWDGGGNVPPALGIAAELRRRGHDVRFLGYGTQRAALEKAGFATTAYTHARPWDPMRPPSGPAGALRAMRLFGDAGPGRDVAAEIDRTSPDLVVADCLCVSAVRAATRSGRPTAVLAHTFSGYLRTWARGPMGLAAAVGVGAPLREWGRADLVLVTSDARLDPGGRLPGHVRHTGAVVPGAAPAASDDRAGDPTVLVSLSTVGYPHLGSTVQRIIDALAGLPVRAVVTSGPAVDPGSLRAAANTEILRYRPHRELLPSASLVISHGGHATAMAALAHDVPLLVLPLHPLLDHAMVGRAVQDAGAGRSVRRTASTTTIAAAVTDLLTDPAHRAAAATVGARLRAQDGATGGADALEELLVRRGTAVRNP